MACTEARGEFFETEGFIMTSLGKAILRSSSSAVALGFFMTGTAALADVTAQDVWADWKGYMAGSG